MMGLGSMAKSDMKTVWKPKERDLSLTSTHRKATRTLPTLEREDIRDLVTGAYKR